MACGAKRQPLTPDEIGAFTARLAGTPGVASPLAPRVVAVRMIVAPNIHRQTGMYR
jgi:hypothetical protein